MLIFDFHAIGNNLYAIRRRRGLTQAEVAEAADISDRTYADIERGTVNMRIETLLRICRVLQITPNDILTDDHAPKARRAEEFMEKLVTLPQKEQQTALDLLSVYLRSLS